MKIRSSSDNPFSGELPRTVRLRDGQFAEVTALVESTAELPYSLLGRLRDRDRSSVLWTIDGAYEPDRSSSLDIIAEVLPDGTLLGLRKAGKKGRS